MERDHMAELSFHQKLHRSSAEAGREHAAETRWSATALQVTEHDVAGFLPGERFELGGDTRAISSEPFDVLPAGRLYHRRVTTHRAGAFGDDDNAEPGAQCFSSRDARGYFRQVEGQL